MLLEDKIIQLNNQFNTLKEKHVKNCIIWGGGEHTEKLFSRTELASLPISGIVDSYHAGESLFAYQLQNPEEVEWKKIDAVIVSSFIHQDEIAEDLKKRFNFSGNIILCYGGHEKVPFYKLQSRKSPIIWEGNYATWGSALAACAQLKFPDAYEADSILDYNIKELDKNPSYENHYHLISWLMKIAVENGNRLTVLDFGGTLANIYYAVRPFFADLEIFKWIVVEQEHFAAYGSQHLENKELSFYASMEDVFKNEECSVTVALCSSVFSYIENWTDYLLTIMRGEGSKHYY